MNQTSIVQALFLLIAMSSAGVAHILWLRTALSLRFAWPVDGRMSFRGRRIFGDNKRVCGFLALPPATAASFLLLGSLRELFPGSALSTLWPLTPWQYAGLGLVCGFAFLMAELPNSFFKRQLNIAPGGSPDGPRLRTLTLLIDRYDSVIGVLIVLSLLVPVTFATWIWVLLLGPVIHALFSYVMHGLGLKARAL